MNFFYETPDSYPNIVVNFDLKGFPCSLGFSEKKSWNNNYDLKEKSYFYSDWLNQYFQKKVRSSFLQNLNLGSEFRNNVFSVVCSIPFGHTMTYGEIAKMIGKEKASQAVGQCLGSNKLPIFIPCHRVLGKKSIGGFSCQGGVELKRKLLVHEGINLTGYED